METMGITLQTIIFFICFRQVSIEQIQTSIIHLAPCSQEIHVIDNENPIFFTFFFLSVMSMVSMETKTEFDKSAIQTQQKLFSSINFSIIFKIKSANFPIVNYFR
jgi:hypothetical protein